MIPKILILTTVRVRNPVQIPIPIKLIQNLLIKKKHDVFPALKKKDKNFPFPIFGCFMGGL